MLADTRADPAAQTGKTRRDISADRYFAFWRANPPYTVTVLEDVNFASLTALRAIEASGIVMKDLAVGLVATVLGSRPPPPG